MKKLKQLVEHTANYYSKVLEYNRIVTDCIFSIFSDHTKYDSLAPSVSDEGLKEYSQFVDAISKLETTNVNIYESLTQKITEMVETTKGWDEYFIDMEKLKKDKTEAYKSYEYYVTKLKKLKSNPNIENDRIERNELKCIKAHSEYFSKSYKAYSHLEKLSQNLYSTVTPALISIHNFQRDLYIETAKTYLDADDIESLLSVAEKKYNQGLRENTKYNPMIYDKQIEDLIVYNVVRHHSSFNLKVPSLDNVSLADTSYCESYYSKIDPKDENQIQKGNTESKGEEVNFFTMLKNKFS